MDTTHDSHGLMHLPTTRLGKRAMAVAGGFIAAFAFMNVAVATGQTGGDTLLDNLWLGIPGVIAGVFGISAGATAVLAIVRERERSILVIVTAVVGTLITVFLAGELIVPH